MVRDVCPLLHPKHASITASRWIIPVAGQTRPVVGFANGHTVALFVSRLITWHRSFTRDTAPPPPFDPPSYIYIHEWLADSFPVNHPSWRTFGISSKQAIAFIEPGQDYHKSWSDHARRHLKIFKKSGAHMRIGTFEELKQGAKQSHLAEDVMNHTIEQTEAVLACHPEYVDILVAEMPDSKEILGFFVAANCDEVLQSYYIGGFYTNAGARAQAMTGLIDWWFERSIARGYTNVNFGDMAGPHTPKFDPSIGYSNFKTHFGVYRVWRPRTLWKIRFKFRHLDDIEPFVSD